MVSSITQEQKWKVMVLYTCSWEYKYPHQRQLCRERQATKGHFHVHLGVTVNYEI